MAFILFCFVRFQTKDEAGHLYVSVRLVLTKRHVAVHAWALLPFTYN